MRKLSLRLAALFVSALTFATGVTCADSSTGPKNGLTALVGVAPVFSKAATDIYRNLVSLEFAIDNIHVVLKHANGDVAIDTVVTLAAGQEEVVLELKVSIAGTQEALEARIDLRDGTEVLFSGTQTITARSNVTSPPTETVELEYAGPGATVTTLVVGPDTTISGVDDITMRPVGRDAGNQVVANLALTWSIDGSSDIGSVTQAGVFQPTGARGTVDVIAELPTGVQGSATVTIVPPATSVMLISGGNQTAPVGATLEVPIVVEVRAADGLPVPGHPVSFAVTAGGGGISPPSAVTNVNGRASAVLTLGTTAGTNLVQVTPAGVAPISVSATGTPGAAAALAIVQQPSSNAVSGQTLGTQPQVQLRDAFGNNVTTGNVAITASLNPLGAWTLQGTLTRNTTASGVAAFTDLMISGPAGSTALQFAASGLTGVASQSIAVTTPALDVVTWVNPAGGNWSAGANWSTGVVPTSTENVAISLAGTYTVTLDQNVVVASLTLGGNTGTQTLTGAGRTLGVNGAATITENGVLTLTASSSLAGAGTVTNQGTITLANSTTFATTTLANHAMLILRGNTLVGGPLTTSASSVVRVQGSTAGSHANVTVSNGFTNNGQVELTSIDGGFSSLLTVTAGTLVNVSTATITSAVGAGGARTLTAQINNQGTLLVDQQLTLSKADADHVNNGTIDLTTGSLVVGLGGTTPSFANNGAIAVGTNRTMSFTGGLVLLQPGVVSGGPSARLIVTGATLDFTSASITVPLTMTTSTVVGGSITITADQTLTLFGGAVADPVTVQTGGTLVTLGTITLNGAVTAAVGSTIRVLGNSPGGHATLNVTNGFTNNGSIQLTSADGGFTSIMGVTNGTLTNAVGATISSMVGAGGVRSLGAQLDNQGLLDVDQPLILQRGEADHTNSGSIDLTNANLNLNQTGTSPSFTNAGSVVLGANRTWIASGGAMDLSAGTVTGPETSTLVVGGATLAFTTATVTMPLTLTTTTIVGGAVTIADGQTLTMLGGELLDPVTIESGGTLLTLGAAELDGAVTLAAGGTLRVRGQSTGGHAHTIVANGFTNDGRIELTSADGGFTSQLTVTAGTLLNTLNATIHSMPGAGGQRLLNARLTNDGTLDVDQALTLAQADADHANSGTIDLATADLAVTLSGTGPSFVNTGGISLGVSRNLTIGGGAVDLSAGTVTGPPSATLFVNNATLAFTTTTVTIPMTLTTTAIQGGSVTVPDGRTLTLLNGGLSDPVTIESGGTLLTLGAVGLTGAVTLPTGGTLRVRGQSIGSHAVLTVANGFTNNGLIELTSADGGFSSTLAVTTGPLINAFGAMIHSAVGALGARTLAAQLNNQGTLDVDQALALDRPSSNHYNSNFIDLTNANLTVTQGGTTPSFGNGLIGNITLGTNRQLTVTGGSLNLIGNSVIQGQPTSTLIVSGAVLQFTPPRVTIPLTLNSTTILGGSLSVASGETVTLLNGGLSDPVSVESGGTLVTFGSVTLATLNIPSENAVVRVQGQSNGSHASLTVANSFTNLGLIELTSIDGGFSSTLAVTNGTLTNSSVIRSASGAGGARVLQAQLDNQSSLQAQHPLLINKPNAHHVNNAVIDLTTSGLTITQSADGSFTNNSDGQINIGAAAPGLGQTWAVNGGMLDIDQGTITGNPEGTSRIIVTGAVLAISTSRLSGTVPLTLLGGTSISGGTLTVQDGDELTLLDGGLPAASALVVEGGGLLKVHGNVTLNGPFDVESSAEVQIRGQSLGSHATLIVANGFTNHGDIQLTSIDGGFSSTLAVTNGTLTNGGVIFSLTGASGARVLAAQLNNQGTLSVEQPITLNRASAQHTNTGLLELHADMTVTQSGTTPSFNNSGTITLENNTLTVTGGPFINNLADAQAIRGPGTLNVGTNFLNNGEVRPSGVLNVSGGYPQVAPSGNLSIQISPSGGSSCAVSDQLVATGAASLAGGLNVFLNDCVLTNNQVFTILTAASVTGTFDYTPISIQGGQLNIEYTATQARLRFVIP